MKEFTYTIKDELGIHARPAGMLAKVAKECTSTVKIEKDGKSSDVTRLMGVMAMGIKQGQTVKVVVEGADEDKDFETVKAFFEQNL